MEANDKTITINKKWVDGLIKIVDKLDRKKDVDNRLSYLRGYVNSLVNYIKIIK